MRRLCQGKNATVADLRTRLIFCRVLVLAMFVESALVYSGLLNFQYIVFYTPWIFKLRPEIWRLCTAFLLTGPNFSFVIDLYFSQFSTKYSRL